jgi:membrane-bound metal-dependent hydrolase YbcI (DUF457 family)
MDLFTHVLLAYLITYGVVGLQPQYLAAGALAGALPDADALFFPLARRFPILRHHGITHSILGVTIIALVGGVVFAPLLAPGNPWVYFLVMWLGGLSHILEDGFTHFSVAPLLPFSERKLELDADRAINFVTMFVSIAAFYVFLVVERGHVPFAVFQATIYAMMAFYAAYFAIRLTARLWVGRKIRREGQYSVPVPTTNPFKWLLLDEARSGGRVRTAFARYTFGRGVTAGPYRVDVPLTADPKPAAGPVTTANEALERSYPLARDASPIFDETYHFGQAKGSRTQGWFAVWYSLEFTILGRAAAVEVHFRPDGTTGVRRAWYTPLWRKDLA